MASSSGISRHNTRSRIALGTTTTQNRLPLPSLGARQKLEDKLKAWKQYINELAKFAFQQLKEAKNALYENPDKDLNRNWYTFAGGVKSQLLATIRQYQSEINDLDHSYSEDIMLDRINEIMNFLAIKFNPETMSFRGGSRYVSSETAANLAAALSEETRGDMVGFLKPHTQTLFKIRTAREKVITRREEAHRLKHQGPADKADRKERKKNKRDGVEPNTPDPISPPPKKIRPKRIPPPTKRLQDMSVEERKKHQSLIDSVKRNISQMESIGEKRVQQTLERSQMDTFGSGAKLTSLPQSLLPPPVPGTKLPTPVTSREPSERLLDMRKKTANVGVIPLPSPVPAQHAEEIAERKQRTDARTEQVRLQQQRDLEFQKMSTSAIPLSQQEREQIAAKQHSFAEHNETVGITNRAITSLRQIMLDMNIQPNTQLLSLPDEATAISSLAKIVKYTPSDQRGLDKYMSYLWILANSAKSLKSQTLATQLLAELSKLGEKLGIDPNTGKYKIPGVAQIPEALTLEQEWSHYFNEIYNQVQQVNDQLLTEYEQKGDQVNENACLQKIQQFLSLRQENQQRVEEAIGRGDINEIAEVAFAAIAPLQSDEFMCNDISQEMKRRVKLQIESLPQKLTTTKVALLNEEKRKEAAARGLERRKQMELIETTPVLQPANLVLSESAKARRDADIAKAKEIARRRAEGSPRRGDPNAPVPPPTKRLQDLTEAERAARKATQDKVEATLRAKQEEGLRRKQDVLQKSMTETQFNKSRTLNKSHQQQPYPIPNVSEGVSANLLAQRSRTAGIALTPKPPPVKPLTKEELAEVELRKQRESERSEQMRLQNTPQPCLSILPLSDAERNRITERQELIAQENSIITVANKAINLIRSAMNEHNVTVTTAVAKPLSIGDAMYMLEALSKTRFNDKKTIDKYLNSLFVLATVAKPFKSEVLATRVIDELSRLKKLNVDDLPLTKSQVSVKVPTTDDWLLTFKQLYDDVEAINNIVVTNSPRQDTNLRQKKITKFAKLRSEQESRVKAAVRTKDRTKIVRAILAAIEQLENLNFVSSDVGDQQAQALIHKIHAAKIPLKNQMLIDQAAAKGSQKVKQIEKRQSQPPVMKSTRQPKKPEPRAGPSGLFKFSPPKAYVSAPARQTKPIVVGAPLNELEAAKGMIAPRLDILRKQYIRSPDQRVVSTSNMINASLRIISKYNSERKVSLPLANELPSPRSSMSEVKLRQRIDEIRASKSMAKSPRGF